VRVLVTGGTGFLGQSLVRYLLSNSTQVYVLTRSVARARWLQEQGAVPVLGDITDSSVLQGLGQRVEVVYHLAGRLFDPSVPSAEYYRLHVEGTRTVLAWCRRQLHLQRFVHVSTAGVLGVTGHRPVPEDAPGAPTNAYEQSKWEGELLVRRAAADGLPTVVVRPSLVYGPGDLHLLGLFQTIQRRLFRPIGRRPVWLHPVFVEDVVRALMCCACQPEAAGECFHIAGPAPVTVADFAATIATALSTSLPPGIIPLPVAWALAVAAELLPRRLQQRVPLTRSRLHFLTHDRVYDTTKARSLLGFSAKTELPQGIARTIVWYRRQGYLPGGL